ncbi:MAG: hypothetical protein R3F29_15185 [Planctomycetota bacterium]
MATTPPRRLALSWLAVTALVACSGDAAASPTRIPDSDEVHRLVFAELGVFDNGAMLQDLKLVRGAGNNYAGSGTVPGIGRIAIDVDVHEKVLTYNARLVAPAEHQGLVQTLDWTKTGEIRVPQ